LKAASIVLCLLALAAPVAGFFVLLVRLRRRIIVEQTWLEQRRMVLFTAVLGALFFLPGWLLETWIQRWAGLDEHGRSADMIALVYAFLVAAPLEQGLKVAAVAPAWRSRLFQTPIDGIVYAAAAGLGFVSAHNVGFLLSDGAAPINALRAFLAPPAHIFFAAAWGYTLGRDKRRTAMLTVHRRIGGRAFNFTWLGAMLFNGVFDHLVFARGTRALIATGPILLCMGFIGYAAARDTWKHTPSTGPATRRQRFLRTIAPPSIREVRAALSRSERPLMLRWIGFGALVQAGMITTCLALSVMLGRRMGVDFAAVDRVDAAGASSIAPLFMLGFATLVAFPLAGYLIARASATHTVLEPAIAAALAILGTLVLLGLAAPITVVFALALAPVAFGLACAGAWVGITR
jgi:RsiW-degrading membrane proteinase PrsW (M82 family)